MRAACVMLMALGTACSSQPERAAHASVAATSVRTVSGQDAVAADPPASDLDQQFAKEGYRLSSYHGQRLYCRTESVTGTRFSGQVCLTASQLQERERNAKDFLNRPIPDSTCIQSKCN